MNQVFISQWQWTVRAKVGFHITNFLHIAKRRAIANWCHDFKRTITSCTARQLQLGVTSILFIFGKKNFARTDINSLFASYAALSSWIGTPNRNFPNDKLVVFCLHLAKINSRNRLLIAHLPMSCAFFFKIKAIF